MYAPAFFLASRRTDRYPVAGSNLTLGADATPEALVESLSIATQMLSALVRETDPSARAILFRGAEFQARLGAPADFVPRAALELILHAHDVCSGLGIPFEPPADLCERLRDHTADWELWAFMGPGLEKTNDAWADLLRASGR